MLVDSDEEVRKIENVRAAFAQRLSPLTSPPEWARLEAFQETMTRDEFARLLDTVYAPGGAAAGMIEVREHDAVILKTLTPAESFTLRFAKDAASEKAPPRNWRTPGAELRMTGCSGTNGAMKDPGFTLS